MYSVWYGLLPLAVFLWLNSLSFLVWQQSRFFRSLFPKSGERDIRRKFEEILGEVGAFRKDLDNLNTKLSEIENQGFKAIQKVELMRFNPYNDTGGDQSFTIALLNKRGSGFVLTSLHARSGTRVFAKPITLGKASKYQLSSEEEQVVEKAIKND